MKWCRQSRRMIDVESYVTLRKDWPQTLQDFAQVEHGARGHRVVDGRMEWRYFADEVEARKWADLAHEHPNTIEDPEQE